MSVYLKSCASYSEHIFYDKFLRFIYKDGDKTDRSDY
jgi:hypothetical protein